MAGGSITSPRRESSSGVRTSSSLRRPGDESESVIRSLNSVAVSRWTVICLLEPGCERDYGSHLLEPCRLLERAGEIDACDPPPWEDQRKPRITLARVARGVAGKHHNSRTLFIQPIRDQVVLFALLEVIEQVFGLNRRVAKPQDLCKQSELLWRDALVRENPHNEAGPPRTKSRYLTANRTASGSTSKASAARS